MPTIAEATNRNLAGYTPAQRPASPEASLPPAMGLEPVMSTMMRCPLPPIFQAAPDSLRQFYQGGKVPQNRFLSPVVNGIAGGSSGGNAVVTTVNQSGSGTNPPPVQTVAKNVAITTTVLGPGAVFQGTLAVSRSYQLLSVQSSVPARVELYGTNFQQIADLSRALDTAPPAGSTQGIVTDVALDTAPLSWSFQNRVGANGDSPQAPNAYITITNLSGAAVAVTVNITYVPIEA